MEVSGIDLTGELKEEHQEKWVALDRRNYMVVAVGETSTEAGDKAEATGHNNFVLFYVPSFEHGIIPSHV